MYVNSIKNIKIISYIYYLKMIYNPAIKYQIATMFCSENAFLVI